MQDLKKYSLLINEYVLFSVLILLLIQSITYGEIIHATGSATILNNDIVSAKAEAIEDAKIKALQKHLGIIIDSGDIVSQGIVIDSWQKITASGIIKKYTILKEKVIEKFGAKVYQIRIKCTIYDTILPRKPTIDDVQNNYSVIININEKWQKKKDGMYTPFSTKKLNSICESSIIRNLLNEHYAVVKKTDLKNIISPDIQLKNKKSSSFYFKQLQISSLANIYINGLAQVSLRDNNLGSPFTENSGLLCYGTYLEVDVFDMSTSQLICHIKINEGQTKEFGTIPERTAEKSLLTASNKLIDLLIPAMNDYSKQSGWARDVTIKIFNLPDFTKLRWTLDLLRNIRWVEFDIYSIDKRKFNSQCSIIIIKYSQPIYFLTSKLSMNKHLKLLRASRSSIELEFIR